MADPDPMLLTKIEVRQAFLNNIEELRESRPNASDEQLLAMSFGGELVIPTDEFLSTVFHKTGLGSELDEAQQTALVANLANFDSSTTDRSVVLVSLFYAQLRRSLTQAELVEVAKELQNWIDEADDESDDEDSGEDAPAKESGNDDETPAFLQSFDEEGGFLEKLDDLGFDYGLSDEENRRLFLILGLGVHKLAAEVTAAEESPELPTPDSGAGEDARSTPLPNPTSSLGDMYGLETVEDVDEEDPEEEEDSDADVLADLDAHIQESDVKPPTPRAIVRAMAEQGRVPLSTLTALQTYMLLRATTDVQGTATSFRDLQFDGQMLSELTGADIDEIAELNDAHPDSQQRISVPLRAAREHLVQWVEDWKTNGVVHQTVQFKTTSDWVLETTADDPEIVQDPVHRDMMVTLDNMLQDIDDLYQFRDSIEAVMRSIAVNNFQVAQEQDTMKHSMRNSFNKAGFPS